MLALRRLAELGSGLLSGRTKRARDDAETSATSKRACTAFRARPPTGMDRPEPAVLPTSMLPPDAKSDAVRGKPAAATAPHTQPHPAPPAGARLPQALDALRMRGDAERFSAGLPRSASRRLSGETSVAAGVRALRLAATAPVASPPSGAFPRSSPSAVPSAWPSRRLSYGAGSSARDACAPPSAVAAPPVAGFPGMPWVARAGAQHRTSLPSPPRVQLLPGGSSAAEHATAGSGKTRVPGTAAHPGARSAGGPVMDLTGRSFAGLSFRAHAETTFSQQQLERERSHFGRLTRSRAEREEARAAEIMRRMALTVEVTDIIARLGETAELDEVEERVAECRVDLTAQAAASEAHGDAIGAAAADVAAAAGRADRVGSWDVHDAVAAELTRARTAFRALNDAHKQQGTQVLECANRVTELQADLEALAWARDAEAQEVAQGKDARLAARVRAAHDDVAACRKEVEAQRARDATQGEALAAAQRQCDGAAATLAAARAALPERGHMPAGTRRTVLCQLTEAEEARVDEVLTGPYPPTPALATFNGQTVSKHDMRTLRPLEWVNDEVINLYLKLVLARAEERLTWVPNSGAGMGGVDLPLSAHVFQTFFWNKLHDKGSYDYSKVRRWTKKIDVFALDAVICPINQNQTHWVLGVINMRQKRFEFFDSMGGSGDGYLCAMRRYLEDEHKDKKKAPIDLSGWQDVVWKRRHIPFQNNGSDCGVFMCQFASTIVRNIAVNFSCHDMPYIRRRMVIEILDTRLKDDPPAAD